MLMKIFYKSLFVIGLTCFAQSATAAFIADGITYAVVPGTENCCEIIAGDEAYSGDIVIPSTFTYEYRTYTVTAVGAYAFSRCLSLTSITLPETVTSIGKFAFYRCRALSAITLPKSVTIVEDYAFSYCSSLTSIAFPDDLTSIGENAFSRCSSLTSITLPDHLLEIHAEAFAGCDKLKTVNCQSVIPPTCSNGVFGEKTFQKGVLRVPDASVEAYLSAGEWGSFCNVGGSNQSGITYFSVDGIAYRTYSEAADSCEITIRSYSGRVVVPSTVTYGGRAYTVSAIGESAFSGSSVTSITIPETVTRIGMKAFSGCGSLTSVTLPKRLTSIGEYLFWGCSSLPSIVIPEGVTSIREHAFKDCSSLTAITIPQNLSNIEYGAFWGCSSLTSIAIPQNVTFVEYGTFYGCTNLKTVTFPEGLLEIDNSAFYGCSNLTTVNCLATTPPTCDTGVFGENTLRNGQLRVPAASVNAYKTAVMWHDFFTIGAIETR